MTALVVVGLIWMLIGSGLIPGINSPRDLSDPKFPQQLIGFVRITSDPAGQSISGKSGVYQKSSEGGESFSVMVTNQGQSDVPKNVQQIGNAKCTKELGITCYSDQGPFRVVVFTLVSDKLTAEDMARAVDDFLAAQ